MENKTIARIFEEIADFLEIKQENAFKIRSYRNAAKIIENFPRRIEDFVKEGGDLRSIQGIGEAISKKIMEILETGDCKLHRRLVAEMPYSLLELLKVPNLGPRTVGQLYYQYGIKTLDELREFLTSPRALEVAGLGKKKIEKILRGLDRIGIYLGKFTVEEVEEALSIIKQEIPEAEPVGSYRRWDELFPDLDVLIPPSQLRFPWPSKEESGKVTFTFPAGIPVDFFARTKKGIWLLLLTGPRSHIEFLKKRAEQRGGKLTENGLFLKDRFYYESEEEIYSLLGLDYIPPQLRHYGELEKVPKLVDERHLKGDLHVHTDWSDGKETLEGVINRAKELGYEYIGISDHSQSSRIANGLTPERLFAQMEKARELEKNAGGIKVFVGCEVDILEDGRLDFPDLVLSKLDYVIASIHLKQELGKEDMTRRILTALENPYVNILGHPTARLLGKRPPIEADWEAVFKKAEERKVAIEINCQPDRLDLPYWLLEKAKNYDLYFVINTDAHCGHSIKALRRYGVMVARKAAIPPERIINTWEWEKVARFFHKMF